MNIIKTRAIVLKSFKYSDSSTVVTLFTEDHGKLNVIVRGSRRTKSGFRGNVESFNLIRVIFNKKDNRDLQVLRNAENIDSFTYVKADLGRLNVAYGIASLLDSCLHDYDKHIESFDVSLEVLNELNSGSENIKNLLLYFKVNFLKSMGLNVLDFNTKYNETFLGNNSLHLNERQFNIVKRINSSRYYQIKDLMIDTEDSIKVNSDLDYILDGHTYRRTNRKAKTILQQMIS